MACQVLFSLSLSTISRTAYLCTPCPSPNSLDHTPAHHRELSRSQHRIVIPHRPRQGLSPVLILQTSALPIAISTAMTQLYL